MTSVSSFTVKQLRVTLTLVSPNTVFPGTNSNVLILQDLRMSAQIEGVTGISTNANLRIYGMSQDDMNALSVAWFKLNVVTTNLVVIEANDGNGWVQVFQGIMLDAQPEYRTAPDVYFNIQASVQYFSQLAAADPSSYTGDTAVAQIAKDLAGKMGLAFENNGVTTVLSSPYFAGTLYDQLSQACQNSGTDFYIEGNTVAICPGTQGRLNVPAVILNEDSGLIGYPVVARAGLQVRCIYNSAILAGGKIKVESDVPAANGEWTPFALSHTLESLKPGGAWESVLSAVRVIS